MLQESSHDRLSARIVPEYFLSGPRPRLIDEWQVVEPIWNTSRHYVDRGQDQGYFIFTCSALPPDNPIRHPGAGRVSRFRMRPMSLYESGESDGSISLGALLDGEHCSASASTLTVPDIAEVLCRGGWPNLLNSPVDEAQEWLRVFLDEMIGTDITTAVEKRHNPDRMLKLLKSVAAHTSTTASVSSLISDIDGAPSMSRRTASSYLEAFERVFLTDELPAWWTLLKSSAKVQISHEHHLADPSLSAVLLGATPDSLLNDIPVFIRLFKSMVIRDLRVYAQMRDAKVYHYKNSYGELFDAVIEQPGGTWIPVQIQLGSDHSYTELAARSLIKTSASVDSSDPLLCHEPPNKLVITSDGYGYRRLDGVTVVPITALGP